jgi:hypothetical protein
MKESALYAEIADEARVETAQADVLTVLEERYVDAHRRDA